MAYTAMLVAAGVTGTAGTALLAAGVPAVLRRGRRWAAEGVTARARCLRTFVRPARDNRRAQRRAIVEFHTPDGAAHRAQLAARHLVEGDVVAIRYRPRRPSRVLRADESVGTTGLLIVTVLLAAGLFTAFAVTLHKGLEPDPPPAGTIGWHLQGQ
ncbi:MULTISPECIES: DUF3592 domain-containing protein [Kitasatospora]|uniref:DUF3592 domain-containing protein n=1 Tax=Kitasatospora setae (strain ATCC 33774 / DSM 43861 / JCM 3304 / KCC A-0304 / NBRC 14216 / KM-6054) TaxID=452652 RepID=E4N220_KITSK|nr:MULTISPECIES: DUF3592 domain-containing protein [Kitasatospora]BAJ32204.1 hypothetical protein KSE_64450 [Kitasatospora setae KM-6054]